MKARSVFINNKQLTETGSITLACNYQTPECTERYVNLDDIIRDLQHRCDADAYAITKENLSEQHDANFDMKVVSARWTATNEILEDLKRM